MEVLIVCTIVRRSQSFTRHPMDRPEDSTGPSSLGEVGRSPGLALFPRFAQGRFFLKPTSLRPQFVASRATRRGGCSAILEVDSESSGEFAIPNPQSGNFPLAGIQSRVITLKKSWFVCASSLRRFHLGAVTVAQSTAKSLFTEKPAWRNWQTR